MRRFAFAVILLFLVVCPCVAQRSSPSFNTNTPTEVGIHVVRERGQPLGQGMRVVMLSSRNTPVQETFTDDLGVARFQLFAGEYIARVTGPDLVEPVEVRVSVYPREAMKAEYATVKLKSEAQNTSSQGYVSAASLQVPDKARGEYDKGVKAMNDANLDEARKRLEKATELYPRYAEAFNALGVIAMRQNQPDEGRKHFQAAIHADEQHPAAYVNLAKLNMREQKFTEGESLLLKAISFTPLDTEALSILSYYELNLGKFDSAITIARKVHSLPHDRYAMVHYVAASALEKKNLNKEAIAEYQLFIKESPAGPSVERAKAAVQTLEARLR